MRKHISVIITTACFAVGMYLGDYARTLVKGRK